MTIRRPIEVKDYAVNPVFCGFNKNDRCDLANLLLRHGFVDITKKTYSEYGKKYKLTPYSETNRKFYFRNGYKRHVIFDYENFYVCSQIDGKSKSGNNITLAELSFFLGIFFFLPGVKYIVSKTTLLPPDRFYNDVVFTHFDIRGLFKPEGPAILHTSKKNEFMVHYTFLENKHDTGVCMNWEAPLIFKVFEP